MTPTEARTIGWLPIESAPKDGTDILVACKDGEVWAVRYVHPDPNWYNEWLAQAEGTADGLVVSFKTDDITHWMPLPEPPQ